MLGFALHKPTKKPTMAVTVETLDKLERKVSLTVPLEAIHSEVSARLKRIARTVKMDGFRPGKVPMNVVAQRYGGSVQFEVMNDKMGEAFSNAAREADLRVAGSARLVEKEDAPEGLLAFDVVFEVFPEVVIKDLGSAQVDKYVAEVSEAAIDKTLGILQRQRRTFSQRSHEAPTELEDRVTVDFEGKIDGEPFDGGKATDFQFIVGEGRMLKEFEDAVLGMKAGDSKTFPLSFPEDYQGKDVAGKQADFMVTIKKLEASHLPAVDDALAKALGVADSTVEGLRADIRKNLEREVKARLLSRNKSAALDALLGLAELDLPKSSVQTEIENLVNSAREDLKRRGIKDAATAPVPEDLFRPQAERRVRLGLVVGELVHAHQLQPTPEQISTHIQELAASYEKPQDVVRWYHSDKERLAEVHAVVLENNVTEFVLANAQVNEKAISFEELMGQS